MRFYVVSLHDQNLPVATGKYTNLATAVVRLFKNFQKHLERQVQKWLRWTGSSMRRLWNASRSERICAASALLFRTTGTMIMMLILIMTQSQSTMQWAQ